MSTVRHWRTASGSASGSLVRFQHLNATVIATLLTPVTTIFAAAAQSSLAVTAVAALLSFPDAVVTVSATQIRCKCLQ